MSVLRVESVGTTGGMECESRSLRTAVQALRYGPGSKSVWNDFARVANSGTFLFDRSYMDYHADRFQDHSLMVFDQGRLAAIFPANLANPTMVASHDGLTYGGLITGNQCTLMEVMHYF